MPGSKECSPAKMTRDPAGSGRGILVAAGSEGGLSGPGLAQQGCSSPHGISLGANPAKTSAIKWV